MRVKISLIMMLWMLDLQAQPVNGITPPVWMSTTAQLSEGQADFVTINDPGSMADSRSFCMTIAAERRIIQADLQYFYASFSLPVNTGGIGFSVIHFAAAGFTQSKLGFAFGKKLSPAISLGIRMNYHRISVPGYGSGSALTPSIGMCIRLAGKTFFHFLADDPYGGRLGKSSEKIGSYFSANLTQHFSDRTSLGMTLAREQFLPTDILVMLRHNIHTKISLDGGISLNRANGFAGTSVSFRQLTIKQIICWSQALGFGTALVLQYRQAEADD